MESLNSKVSICIPTYNQVAYLPLAVRSALAQTLTDVEVVISDNHSTDGTADYLASLSDPRIKVVRPPKHLTAAQNFDWCISQSAAGYFSVLCSDDLLQPAFAGALARVLDERPSAAFAYSAAAFVDEDGRVLRVERHLGGSFFRPGKQDIQRFVKGAGCVFTTMMFRREFFDRAGGFSTGAGACELNAVNDWDLQLRLLEIGDIAYHDEVLADFRVWSEPEREARHLRHLAEIGQLYETRIAAIQRADPSLSKFVSAARNARALSGALGLGKLSGTPAFEEGARLVRRISDSFAVRCVLWLHTHRLGRLAGAWAQARETLRGIAKAVFIAAGGEPRRWFAKVRGWIEPAQPARRRLT